MNTVINKALWELGNWNCHQSSSALGLEKTFFIQYGENSHEESIKAAE